MAANASSARTAKAIAFAARAAVWVSHHDGAVRADGTRSAQHAAARIIARWSGSRSVAAAGPKVWGWVMKLLMHIVVRAGAEAAFGRAFERQVERLRQRAAPTVRAVTAMRRVAGDPFGARTPYSATLEIRADGPPVMAQVQPLIEALAGQFSDTIHADLCTALVGEDHIFVPCERTPIRYQYLMRRNAAFTHEGYLRRYAEIHSTFGLRTPGIRGYVQFHIDPAASQEAAHAAGVGIWGVDSVSELYLDSVEDFLSAVSQVSDEEQFVDRANSLDFCSVVDWQV
jgi:hypothetical protein